MNMKKIFLAVLVLINSFVYGQKEDFDKAVDFCNCQLTSAYLSKYTSNMSSEKADKKSFEQIRNDFGKCEIGSSIDYTKLSDLLDNNNFKYSNANFSKVINDLKSAYKDNLDKDEAVNRIIKGIFENKSLEGAIKKYINSEELKGKISTAISTYFEGKFKLNEISGWNGHGGNGTKNEISNQIKEEVNNRMQDWKPNPWAFNYLSLIFAILGIVVAYIIIKIKVSNIKETFKELQQSRSDQRGELNTLKSTIEKMGYSGGGKTQSNYRNDWQSNIEEKISEANRAIGKLDVAISMLRDEIGNSGNIGGSFVNSPKVEQLPKAEILYASIPSKDGFFNENAISNNINPTASFYKLTITDSYGQKAKFEFLGNDERAVKDATNAPERILRPACKINNALNQNAKRIKTTTPGTAIKQNGKWEIDTLAEIEYE